MIQQRTSKIFISISAACIAVIMLAAAAFAWFQKGFEQGGIDIATGKISLTLTTYAYNGTDSTAKIGSTTEPLGGDAPASTGEHTYSIITEEKPAVFFVKIEQGEESCDFEYGLTLYLEGLIRQNDEDIGAPDSAIAAAGGFWYNVDKVSPTDVSDEAKELESLTALAQTELPEGADKPALSTIDKFLHTGELTKEANVHYYRVTLGKNADTENVPNYIGKELRMHAVVNANQGGMNKPDKNQIFTVTTAAELFDAVGKYMPGDIIRVEGDIEVSRDLVFNRPVNFYVTNKKTLKVNGNFIYSFNSTEHCEISTAGGGKIVVSRLQNAGGNFEINTPSSKVTLKGSNSLNAGMGDIYVQSKVTLGASYSEGVVIDGCNIYNTTADGTVDANTKNIYQYLYITNHTKLEVTRGTEVGVVRDNGSGVKSININNNGTIAAIKLENMSKDNNLQQLPQIDIKNNGVINLLDGVNISLPTWAEKFVITVTNEGEENETTAFSGNTRIIQDMAGTDMTVGKSNKAPEWDGKSFTDEDIVRVRPDRLVMHHNQTADGTNLIVYYYNTANDDGTTQNNTLASLLKAFFEDDKNKHLYEGSEANGQAKVKYLTVVTASNKVLIKADYDYMKKLTNAEGIDLSQAMTERVSLTKVPVGGTSAKPITWSGYYATIPEGAFENMGNLKSLNLPANTEVIRYRFAYSSGIREVFLPDTFMASEIKYQSGNLSFGAICVPYVHYTSTASTAYGMAYYHYQPNSASFSASIVKYIVPDSLFNEYLEKNSEYLGKTQELKQTIFPESTLVEVSYDITDENTQVKTNYHFEYLVHEVGIDEWEIVYFYNYGSTLPAIIGEGITKGENQYNIVGIYDYAFYGKIKLSSYNLKFADSVRYIGNSSFQNVTVSKLDLNNVETIGNNAFQALNIVSTTPDENGKLPTDLINNKIISIGNNAFYQSNLTNLKLTACTSIGTGAFYANKQLLTADLPQITVLSTNAFYGCSSMTEFKAENVITAKTSALELGISGTVNNSLKLVYMPKCQNLDYGLFMYDNGLQLVVLGRPGEWNGNAFANNGSYGKIIISASTPKSDGFVTKVNSNSAANMRAYISNVISGDYPSLVKEVNRVIDSAYFDIDNIITEDGKKLSELSAADLVSADGPAYLLCKNGDGTASVVCTLKNAIDLKAKPIPKAVMLNEGEENEETLAVTILEAYLFAKSTLKYDGETTFALTASDFPSTLKDIKAYAFQHNIALTEVHLPDSVENIYTYAFTSNTTLTKITGIGVKALYVGVFADCLNLVYADFPSVTYLAGDVFVNDRKLSYLQLGALKTVLGEPFRQANKVNATLIHGKPDANDTLSLNPFFVFGGYGNGIVIGELGTRIYYAGTPKKIMLNEQYAELHQTLTADMVKHIVLDNRHEWLYAVDGSNKLHIVYAFKQTLTTEDIASDWSAIIAAENAQLEEGETPLTTADIVSIGELCFRGTTITSTSSNEAAGIVHLDLSSTGITWIGWHAFDGANITKITLPDTMTVINNSTFFGMSSLAHIIGNGVQVIGDSAFSGITSLVTVEMDNTVTIGKDAFKGCTGLTTLSFDKCTIIGNSAFSGCTEITSISAANVETIGEYSFENAAKIGALTLNKLTYLGNNAFNGAGVTYFASSSLTELPAKAFFGCKTISEIYLPACKIIGDQSMADCGHIAEITLGNIHQVHQSTATIDKVFYRSTVGAIFLPYSGAGSTLNASLTYGSSDAYGACVYLSSAAATAYNATSNKFNRYCTADIQKFTEYNGTQYVVTISGRNYPSVYYYTTEDENGIITVTIASHNFNNVTGEFMRSAIDALMQSEGATYLSLMQNTFNNRAIKGDVDLSDLNMPSIPQNCFAFIGGVDTFTLPDTITVIPNYAMRSAGVKKLIANNVTEIQQNGCNGIKATEIYMPELVKIGENAFVSSGLTSVTLNKVTSVGSSAFKSCSSLTSVTMNAATALGGSAFNYCSSLTNVQFDSLVSINQWNVFMGSGLIEIDDSMFKSLTSVSAAPFSQCSKLKKVTLTSLTTVNGNIFGTSKALEEVYLPNVTGTISADTFSGCTSLKVLYMPKLLSLDKAELFKDKTALEDVNFDAVTEITVDGVFSGCTSLKNVSFASLHTISGSNVFNTTGFTEITDEHFPSLTTITGIGVFRNCNSLLTVTMSALTTLDGESNFASCDVLNTVTMAILPELGGLQNFGQNTDVANASNKLETVNMPLLTTISGKSSFCFCSGLKNVNMPLLETISGQYAFYECTSLETISLPKLTSITKSAVFEHCYNLKTASMPLLANIPDRTFYQCRALANASFDVLTEISGQKAFNETGFTKIDKTNFPLLTDFTSDSVFNNCDSLVEVNHDGILRLNSYTFANCDNLTTVVLKNVTTVSGYAFSKCKSLSSVTMDNLSSIESFVFSDCTSLTELNDDMFPSLTNLAGYSAFSGCTGIKTIYLSKLTTMNVNYTSNFSNCTSLITVNLPLCETIGATAFSGCTALKKVVIPSATSIGARSFGGCSSIVYFYAPNLKSFTADMPFEMWMDIAYIHIGGTNVNVPNGLMGNTDRTKLGYNAIFITDTLGTDASGRFNNWLRKTSTCMLGVLPTANSSYTYSTAVSTDEGYDITKLQAYGDLFNEYNDALEEGDTFNRIDIGEYYYAVNDNGTDIMLVYCMKKAIDTETFARDMAEIEALVGNGAKITSIGKMAFRFTAITGDTLVMPLNVKTIGSQAFCYDGTVIDNLDLANVAKIDTSAFEDATVKNNIIIGDAMESIAQRAFVNAGTSITINATTIKTKPIGINANQIAGGGAPPLFGYNNTEAVLYVTGIAYDIYAEHMEYVGSDGQVGTEDDFYGWARIPAERIVKFGYSHMDVNTNIEYFFAPIDGGAADELELTAISFKGNIPAELVIPSTLQFYVGEDESAVLTTFNITKISKRAIENIKEKAEVTAFVLPDKLEATWFDDYKHSNFFVSIEEFKVGENCENYSVKNGVLYNKDMTALLAYPQAKTDEIYYVPTNITSLDLEMLEQVEALKTIIFGEPPADSGAGSGGEESTNSGEAA